MNNNITVINTDSINLPPKSNNLWENRAAGYSMHDMPGVPKCTVAVLAYNRLSKTKYCVECILEYTNDIDYELLLIDNGSDDGTLEYFESIDYGNKKIIRVSKNIGSGYAWKAARDAFTGKYLVIVSNDVYVTANWLSNLLTCLESDPRIGFVEPVSSNVSNYQQVHLDYTSFEDMQAKAAAFNISDPLKWSERMRLISLIGIYSRPILDIVGINDSAYIHDFIEDDLAMRIRRAGYKLILCGDTWVCHDHEFYNYEDKDPAQYQRSLDIGRAVFKEKYHGVDAWDDILNFEFTLLEPLKTCSLPGGQIKTLVIDGKCGTPVLEIRNHLRGRGILDTKTFAHTTDGIYYTDLQTVADEVTCGPIEAVSSPYSDNMFDIIALCKAVNIYLDPFAILKDLYRTLKPGGVLLFCVKNVFNINAYYRSLGHSVPEDIPCLAVTYKKIMSMCEELGAKDKIVNMVMTIADQSQIGAISNMIKEANPGASQYDVNSFLTDYFTLCIRKG